MIESKAFRNFITVYFLFTSEPLSDNIKLTLHKALIRSVMTQACLAWEFAPDNHLLKLQRFLNKALRTIGKFPRCASASELQMAFQVPYIYEYILKLCRQQAEVIKIMKMQMFAISERAKPDTENIKGLILAAAKCTTVEVTRQPL
jgi:hypothetical protein